MTSHAHKDSAKWLALLVVIIPASVSAQGTWSPTGSMSVAHRQDTATLLSDGRVLVSGGINNLGSITADAEIYDPALGTWAQTGSMSTARNYHTATLLSDGRVLVTGGLVSGSTLASAEIYDPSFGRWELTGTMIIARGAHSATLLPDGRVLVSGGINSNSLASAEIYDPSSGTWGLTGTMLGARHLHTATGLPDGRVLVSGGIFGFNSVASAEIYDPESASWSSAGSMSSKRQQHAATLLSDGRVLVTGGWTGQFWSPFPEIYDPSLGTWALTNRMSIGRGGHTATRLPDGRVLVSGGVNTSTEGTPAASAEIYNPYLASWSSAGSMSTRRQNHTATLLRDVRILVGGGNSGFPATAEIYSPDIDVTPPQVSCGTADGAWHNGDVAIACIANDLESGLVNAADASFNLTTSVEIGTETADADTNSHEVCNTVGECTAAGPITGNKVDNKPPTVSCGVADAAWHGSDVSIACNAGDLGSGLMNAADAGFNLITNVPTGAETTSASTDGRQVCDAVNWCTPAGPVAGNKVDKKGPTVTIAAPIANATYQQNALATASYACTDGGSGVSSCQGPTASGGAIDTSSTGTKTFTVNASDSVGNVSSASVPYSVVTGGGGGQVSADLSLTLSVPGRVAPGGTLTYSIAVKNGSKTTATGAVVSDTLPPGTVFASASTSQGTITAPTVGSNGTVIVNVGSIAGNGTANISIVVTVTASNGATLTDTAKVTATTQDLNQNNNSATKSTKVSK